MGFFVHWWRCSRLHLFLFAYYMHYLQILTLPTWVLFFVFFPSCPLTTALFAPIHSYYHTRLADLFWLQQLALLCSLPDTAGLCLSSARATMTGRFVQYKQLQECRACRNAAYRLFSGGCCTANNAKLSGLVPADWEMLGCAFADLR
jgi:hypothetical protein